MTFGPAAPVADRAVVRVVRRGRIARTERAVSGPVRRPVPGTRTAFRAAPGRARMIGKISAPRGKRVEPLTQYLFGPGRHEHTDPHIVAGFRRPALLEPPLRALRTAPTDKTLSDDEWAAIAHDLMNRTGLSRYGRRTRRSAGSRNGTPMITSTWW